MSDPGTKSRLRSWWQRLAIGHYALIAAALGLAVAALIHVTVDVFDSDPPASQLSTTGGIPGGVGSSGGRDPKEIQPPRGNENSAEGRRGETSDKSRSESQPAPDSSDNGDSRAAAIRLTAGIPMEKRVDSGKDIDWYLYKAPKEEKAHLSFSMDEPKYDVYGSQLVSIFKDSKWIEEDWVAADRPFDYTTMLAKGEKLSLKVQDHCGNGCGVAPYRLLVAIGPTREEP